MKAVRIIHSQVLRAKCPFLRRELAVKVWPSPKKEFFHQNCGRRVETWVAVNEGTGSRSGVGDAECDARLDKMIDRDVERTPRRKRKNTVVHGVNSPERSRPPMSIIPTAAGTDANVHHMGLGCGGGWR